MELMNQPFTGQLGDYLIELLDSQDYHTLNILVAFAKNSGVLRIKDALERFRKRGGVVNVYVGVDLGGTSYEALTALRLHTEALNVVHSEKYQTFHSKIYQFAGPDKGLIIIGSHNLTAGGLWTNFESSVLIPIHSPNVILTGVDNYIKALASLNDSFMPIGSQDDIDKLLKNGYVFKEVSQRIRLLKVAKPSVVRERLFGYGATANLPNVVMPVAPAAFDTPTAPATPDAAATAFKPFLEPASPENQTIWFETRKMTGGSRNILDLSKKSLVLHGSADGTPFYIDEPNLMRGGVEFFGLNPNDTEQIKNITLNFEGVDYTDNSILYPAGDNANGTWRLQIKGTSSSGTKITDAFRAESATPYLVQKIITFTKVQGDYYFMSVFPEAELENFKAASHILARNGSSNNAKLLGLL